MNTLTKVFVVLLLVFSIAFTMMTIQFSVNVPNWKDQAEKWKSRAHLMDIHYRNLVAAKVAQGAQAAENRKAWNRQRDQFSSDLNKSLNELSDYKARLTKVETDLSAQSASTNKLSAELGIAQASAEKARDQRQQLEERSIYLEQARLDLMESLNEKVATIDVLEQRTRHQEQQIHLLKEERDKVALGPPRGRSDFQDSLVLPEIDKVTPQSVPRVAAIRGHIEELSGKLASISVGSDDGVKVGDTFIIQTRDGDYLGDLEITDVEPNSSAGVLKFVTSKVSIGDLAVDERAYMDSN